MKLFVIGDLHLSLTTNKPMGIFGENWENHHEKIKENWENIVSADDIVLVCGDISWALKADDAVPDLLFINELPGKKIIMKGNHDLWWQSMSKLDAMKRLHKLDSIEFLYNDTKVVDEAKVTICGSRGWKTPIDDGFTEGDAKIWRRELMRVESSIIKAAEFDCEPIVFLHFPPFNIAKRESNEMMELLEKYNIKKCYFGHVHNYGSAKYDEEGKLLPIFKKNGVEYYLVSSDYVNFKPEPVEIYEG